MAQKERAELDSWTPGNILIRRAELILKQALGIVLTVLTALYGFISFRLGNVPWRHTGSDVGAYIT